MSDWTSGYVADIGYTYGYYAELNPLRSKIAFLNAGFAPPKVVTACELGYGQGLSTCIHSAASNVQWYGTDFNPDQACFAQGVLREAGLSGDLYDQSFEEFVRRDDLPQFDFIGLHGVWSWVSEENRNTIVELVRKRLSVGGVLYISYNTFPGFAPFVPVRNLLKTYANVATPSGDGVAARIDASIRFAEELFSLNPVYGRVNPVAFERMKGLANHSRQYLAHEYFNRDWTPMQFSMVNSYLEKAKLGFACSAQYLDHIDAANYTEAQRLFIKEVTSPVLREDVRDFVVNQHFRRDYWVKGTARLTALERTEAMLRLRVMLIVPRAEVKLSIKGPVGDIALNEVVYGPVLDALGELKIRSIGEILDSVSGSGVNFAQLIQAVLVLSGSGYVVPVQDDPVIEAAAKKVVPLNKILIEKARSSNEINYLASPVTGGGVAVGRFQKLFLYVMSEKKAGSAEWVRSVWNILKAQGERLLKDGRPLESDDENLAELDRLASEFLSKRLPVLRALRVTNGL